MYRAAFDARVALKFVSIESIHGVVGHPNFARLTVVSDAGVLTDGWRDIVGIDACPGIVSRDVHLHDAMVIHRSGGTVGVPVA